MPESFPPRKPFFQTIFGIIVIIILSLLGIILLIFGGFFGYYLWAQKYAPESTQKELTERFNPSFSRAPGLGSARSEAAQTVSQFIRPHNPTLGSETSRITIVAFIDFECPYCQKSYPIFEQMLQKYDSAVRVVYKNFPIPAIHPNAMGAAIGSACAHEQDKFWPYYHTLFRDYNLAPERITQIGEEIKLDTKKYLTCIENESTSPNVRQDIEDGIALGVQGTPTYFVNQQKLEGVVDIATWDSILLAEIQKKP
jgi:protein-disulfide isomerase